MSGSAYNTNQASWDGSVENFSPFLQGHETPDSFHADDLDAEPEAPRSLRRELQLAAERRAYKTNRASLHGSARDVSTLLQRQGIPDNFHADDPDAEPGAPRSLGLELQLAAERRAES
jgi:hypothetical protein